jgi:hypothetical protein
MQTARQAQGAYLCRKEGASRQASIGDTIAIELSCSTDSLLAGDRRNTHSAILRCTQAVGKLHERAIRLHQLYSPRQARLRIIDIGYPSPRIRENLLKSNLRLCSWVYSIETMLERVPTCKVGFLVPSQQAFSIVISRFLRQGPILEWSFAPLTDGE